MTLPPLNSARVYFRLPFLIAAIALVTATTWVSGWWYVERSLLGTAGEALALGATNMAVELERLMFERYGDLRLTSKLFSGRVHQDVAYVRSHLRWMRETFRVYHWLGVADREGRIVASTSPALLGRQVDAAPWFLETKGRAARGPDAMYMGGVEAFVTEQGGPDTVSVSAAIYDDAGRFEGVVSGRISIPALEALATTTIRTLRTRSAVMANIEYQVLDNRGMAYIDSDYLHKGLINFNDMRLPSVELSRRGGSGFVAEQHQRRRVRVVTGYSRTNGWGQEDPFQWTVLVRMPTAALVAPIHSFHSRIGAVGLAILLPIFGLLVWMQRRLQGEWQVAQTEKQRARSAETHYHVLLQTTDQGIFGVDRRGRCTFINRAAAAMLGCDGQELLGHALHDRLHGDGSCDEDGCPMRQTLTTGNGYRLREQTFHRKDGSRFEVECSSFAVPETGGRTGFVFTFMNIQERKRQTQALLQYQQRLRSLASQLRRTEEQVRQRLATELHDNLAQTLALCHMKLASYLRLAPATFRAPLTPVVDLVKEALRYTRELMGDLRPPTLGDEGDLTATVQWVTAKLERHGLNVTIRDDGRPKPMEPELLRIAYQSLHELLFNVLKHARTTSAGVRLRRYGPYLILEVRDRGVGFRGGPVKAPSQEGGFGLFNMREQIAGAGGRMRIWSVPDLGSRVSIILPLKVSQPEVRRTAERNGHAEKARASSSEGRPDEVRIRVLLVDDHQIMREGLRSMIEGETGCEVVAEAADGETAVELATSLRPDVVLMDVNMPKLNGVEATRRIKDIMPDVSVVGLSVHQDPKLEHLMCEAGASAYLSKGTAFNLVCETVRRVHESRHQASSAEEGRTIQT